MVLLPGVAVYRTVESRMLQDPVQAVIEPVPAQDPDHGLYQQTKMTGPERQGGMSRQQQLNQIASVKRGFAVGRKGIVCRRHGKKRQRKHGSGILTADPQRRPALGESQLRYLRMRRRALRKIYMIWVQGPKPVRHGWTVVASPVCQPEGRAAGSRVCYAMLGTCQSGPAVHGPLSSRVGVECSGPGCRQPLAC